MITPIINTERLILRPFSISDAEDAFKCWESDPDVAKYMFWSSHNSIDKSIKWVSEEVNKINSNMWFRWAIVSKESEELLGTCLIYFEDEYGKFEIAYNLGKKFWGFGYITEAMKAVIEFAKKELKIDEVVARCAKENYASENVIKKLGFKYVKDIPYRCNEGKNTYEGKEYILKL